MYTILLWFSITIEPPTEIEIEPATRIFISAHRSHLLDVLSFRFCFYLITIKERKSIEINCLIFLLIYSLTDSNNNYIHR